MIGLRSVARDPRTIARDIPGVLDTLFPHLVQGVVASFNRRAVSLSQLRAVPAELVEKSKLQKAMLFEIAVAVAEQLLDQRQSIDWDECLGVAGKRQRRYFDATVPQLLSTNDKEVAEWVANNLFTMLRETQSQSEPINRAPEIPGYQWIASGVGDFSIGDTLIEVKCKNKNFSSSDYRQVLMYWLLSYCSAIESGSKEWSKVVLANPRLNLLVKVSFDEIVAVVGGGRSKVDLVESFSAILSDRFENRGS